MLQESLYFYYWLNYRRIRENNPRKIPSDAITIITSPMGTFATGPAAGVWKVGKAKGGGGVKVGRWVGIVVIMN